MPASPSDGIGAGGNVTVTNFPADQLVHFTQPVTVAVNNFPAVQPVSGPLTDAQLAARLPLDTDALTAAELDARLPLSISGAVTGPLTAAELADAELAREETLSEVALTAMLERDTIPD